MALVISNGRRPEDQPTRRVSIPQQIQVKYTRPPAVRTAPIPGELTTVPPTDPEYRYIKHLFTKKWAHPGKTCNMRALYFMSKEHVRNLAKGPTNGWDTLFHGTGRACRIGETTKKPCQNPECRLCSILQTSFKLSHAYVGGMFGPGIYSTPCSSKADSYARNHHMHSQQHAILICLVKCQNRQQLFMEDPYRRGPDFGYDSVSAVTRDKGGAVNYPEIIVYRENQIVPVGIVMYTRTNWDGAP